jgi:hypothetical protein
MVRRTNAAVIGSAIQIETEAQEYPRDHRHDDRHRDRFHGLSHPSRQAEDEQQHARDEEGADHLLKAEMAERRAEQHRAGNAPEEDQRLAVGEREGEAEQAVDEERGEDPRGDVGLGEPAARAHGEDDRHRPGAGEEERDQRVRGVQAGEVRQDLSGPGDRSNGGLERHVVVVGAAKIFF